MSDIEVLAASTHAPPAPPAVRDALDATTAELRAEAARREGEAAGEAASASREIATLLQQTADRLDHPQAWLSVDRFVHEMLGALVADTLTAPEGQQMPAQSARAFALKTMARHEPLWPGAGPRLGCAYSYDSFMATMRMSALATAV